MTLLVIFELGDGLVITPGDGPEILENDECVNFALADDECVNFVIEDDECAVFVIEDNEDFEQ